MRTRGRRIREADARRFIRGAWMLLLAAFLGRCSPVPATQVVVQIYADAVAAGQLQAVTVAAQVQGERPFLDRTFALTADADGGRFALPGASVVLLPRDPDHPDARPLLVTVSGQLPGADTITQTALVSFREQATVYLVMTLSYDCRSTAAPQCGAQQTCQRGTCVARTSLSVPTPADPFADASVDAVDVAVDDHAVSVDVWDAAPEAAFDAPTADLTPVETGAPDGPDAAVDQDAGGTADAIGAEAGDDVPLDAPEGMVGPVDGGDPDAVDASSDAFDGFDVFDAPDDAVGDAGDGAGAGTDLGPTCGTLDGPCCRADAGMEACAAGSTCAAGVCRPTCDGGAVCDGQCVDLSTSSSNCGGCGVFCDLTGAVSSRCTSGTCTPTCVPHRADCDGVPANGCETSLDTSALNCGRCGFPCALSNATAICVAATCAVGTCNAGFANCDAMAVNGCEVDLRADVANCGTCGHACPASPYGTPACAAGTCAFNCRPGYAYLGGVCAQVAPRPLTPLSVATVSSVRPTFRWSLAPATDGARVQVCRDRACTRPEEHDASGSSLRWPTALTPGVTYYWRMYSLSGGVASTAPSAVWEFVTAPGPANEQDNAWGTVPDFDGDGYADLIVGDPNGDSFVTIMSGGEDGIAPSTARWRGGFGGNFATALGSIGDVNGDGYADAAVGAYTRGTYGEAFVYLGGPAGITDDHTVLIGPGAAGGSFGWTVGAAGDVNGDGYGDLLVVATRDAHAYVFRGGPTGVSAADPYVLSAPDNSGGGLPAAATAVGDVNDDGYGDVAVATPVANSSAGQVSFYLGGALGPDPLRPMVLTGPDGGDFGVGMAGGGDFNGDGYADLAIVASATRLHASFPFSGSDALYIYRGGAGGLVTPAMTVLAGSFRGGTVTFVGDVNADGFGDLVVGLGASGQAYLYLGQSSGILTSPIATINGPMGGYGGFGGAVAAAGDTNGDGYPDIAIGARCDRATSSSGSCGLGAAYIYVGGSGHFATTPAVTLVGGGGVSLFGQVLARRSDFFGSSSSSRCLGRRGLGG